MATATPSTLNIAVLAAGEGKRMRSSKPKVLRLLAGRPLLAHILETARKLAPDRICVVYGMAATPCVRVFPIRISAGRCRIRRRAPAMRSRRRCRSSPRMA